MKNFDEILAEVARQNGTTPENVLHEMQLAIDDAYDHHGKESQPGLVGKPGKGRPWTGEA